MEDHRQMLTCFYQESLGDQTRAMTLIDKIVSAQPGLIPQVTVAITQLRFWSATAFADHSSDY